MSGPNKTVMMVTKHDPSDQRCERAVDFCRRHFHEVHVERGQWGDPLPPSVRRFEGDYLFSYMSRWVIPASVLDQVKVAALNFHPATPEYPGVGCTNFALYEGAEEYGVTCHHMSPQVDTGRIIAVDRFPVYPGDEVYSLLDRTYDQMLVLFYRMLDRILSDRPLPESQERWTRPPFKRTELDALCRIDPEMSPEEIERRVRATTFGRWRPVVNIKGHEFELKKQPCDED